MRSLLKHPLSYAFLLVAWFYVWTAVSDNLSWHFGERQTDYYNLLVHGFLKGQLSLDAEVPAELLRVADPYDPAQRPVGMALHDASLYHGKYYIYYGVVPAALVMLPFRAVTGVDLPIGAAVLGCALLAAGFLMLLLAEIHRRFFPRIGPLSLAGIGVTVGAASCIAFLLRRPGMYELPIISGATFALAALWCWMRAVLVSPLKPGWIAAASACWGLAIGSRPIYLLAPLVLAVAWPMCAGRRAEAGASPVGTRRLLLAALLPIGVIGLLLAGYNFARFGDPREFGLNFILSGVYESKIEHFRLRYLPWNLNAYLFASGEWGRYFPFFHPAPINLPRPFQHFGMDHPFGLLVGLPFLWFVGVATVAMAWLGGVRAQLEWRIVVGSLAWAGLSTAAFVLCYYAAMIRYVVDFTPVLALLAAVGAMVLLEWAGGGGRRWWAGVVVVASAAVSVATGFLFTAVLNSRFRDNNPAGYAALARVANAPVHAWEGVHPSGFGPMTLRVVLPRDAAGGRRELLVATGWNDDRDRVWMIYPDAGRIELGFEHAGAPLVRSRPLSLDRGAAHEIKVSLGSLFPPDTHPGFEGWGDDERAALLQRVRLAVDGEVVLDQHQRFYDATPGTVRIGGDRADTTAFSGRVLLVSREGDFSSWRSAASLLARTAQPSIRPDDRGRLRFGARFLAGRAGARDPLVVSGQTGRADFLVVEYLGGGEMRLILDHWGRQPYFSEPISYAAAHEYRVEVSHPFFARGNFGRLSVGEGKLVVSFDGRVVWACEPLVYPVEPQDIYVGRNPVGGTSAPEKFSGEITPLADSGP